MKARAVIRRLAAIVPLTMVWALVPSSPAIAAPKADIDQCGNGPITAPDPTPCHSGNEWENGNLGASKSHYFEDDSVPYRMKLTDLSIGPHTITIKWDTTKSGKHALDYLTTYNRSVDADPCAGFACSLPTSTFAIPADPQVTGAGVTPDPGDFTLFGGTITGVSAYSYPDGPGFTGDKSAQITVSFTTIVPNLVLAWGGHISARADWGANNSAVAISGSPYHMRLVDLDGSGGNQDRSLSADAVIFPASIKIIKDAVPDDPQDFAFSTTGGLTPPSFSLDDDTDGTLSNEQLYSGITSFVSYAVTETTVAGWALSFGSPPCTVTSPNGGTQTPSGSTLTIDLKEGENVSCTFTNARQAAHLIVIKHVVNDNGGSAVAGDFTMNVTGNSPSPASFPGAESPGTDVTLGPGSYSVSESGPAGYTQSLSADCSGTIAAGQTKTCTVTNDDQAATLIVIKDVVNDNGGTAFATDFTMNVTGNNPSPSSFSGNEAGTTVAIGPGTYNVTETGPAGYTATFSTDCSGSIALGQTKTCTVTNDDQAATLIVIKDVVNDDGGTAVAGDFTMNVTGNNPSPNSFPGAGNPGTSVAIGPGNYSVSESGPVGYAATFSTDCTGSIANGETKTCTVTNDDQTATLIVIKDVVNDDGGTAGAGDFTMNVTGNNPSPASFPGAGSPGTSVDIGPGAYGVTETGPAGYGATFSADCTGTIALGQTKTCTVTNNDQSATLIVIKDVVNDDGGTAVAGDFTMNVTGNSPSPASFPGAGSPGTSVDIGPGSYSVSETGPSGYSATFSADCVGSIALGETKTCTVTNDDQTATLIVIKDVVNDNGGSASAGDFTMNVTGNSPNPASFPGDEAGTSVDIGPGGYSVGESGPSGYSATFSADCVGSIALGQTKTCTVTNDDIAPQLTVIKHVINDNGGTASAGDFTLDSGGANDSPDNFPGSEAGTTVTLDAGSYNVTETGPSGYSSSSSADCSGSIGVGETKTCTVTNNDVAPQLTVIKHVINDNGGTAVAGDFIMNVAATNPSDPSFPGEEAPGTTITVDAGSYSVTETGPSGYTASSSADCSGSIAVGETKTCTVTNDDIAPQLTVIKHVINDDGGTAVASDFTLDSGGTNDSPDNFPGSEAGTTVTLDAGSYNVTEAPNVDYAASFSADCSGTIAVGETKTCTVTNDDVEDVAEITPTGTTCQQFRGGTAPPLPTLGSGGQVEYSVKGNKINQTNPGVFFYWVKVTVGGGTQSVVIDQQIVPGPHGFSRLFSLASGFQPVFNENCTAVQGSTVTQATSGANIGDVTVTWPAGSGGTFFVSVKYDTGSVKGATRPFPQTFVDYRFDTNGVGGSTEGLRLSRKN